MTEDARPFPLHPPYTAVIFTSERTSEYQAEYEQVAARMDDLVRLQPGFLGMESVRGTDGVGITVSYWKDPPSATAWKRQAEHEAVQQLGRDRFYKWYRVRVASVETEYGFD